MPDGSPIADLRRAASLLEASGDPAAWRFAARLWRYEADAGGTSLDRAAEVAPLPGRTPWWEQEAQNRRNAAIRAIREQEFPDMGVTAASREIAKLGQRYRRSSRRDPLLDAVTANGRTFPKERRIRAILGNDDVLLVARRS